MVNSFLKPVLWQKDTKVKNPVQELTCIISLSLIIIICECAQLKRETLIMNTAIYIQL